MKQTEIISLNDEQLEEKLKEAGKLIREGGLVVFPTETVYGLGADALNEDAVKEIFKAKGRPQDNPLIVHISSMSQLDGLVEEISEKAKDLAERFWPGPLTILFKKSGRIPYETTAGLETVAVRMPDNEIALKLIEYSERPIAAPSANTSGRPSPTKAEHVLEDLAGKVDIVIDGGATGVGLESTVIDVSTEVPVILRPGGITREQILEVMPEAEYDLALKDESLKPKSPGQKYRHYSPKAKLELYIGSKDIITKAISARQEELEKEGLRVGILTVDENMSKYENKNIVSMGSYKKPDDIARNLFDSLRTFDSLDVDVILGESVEETGIGKAIFNRLYKASGGNIVYI
jgi:L-threonylcarbamoyladenylate synthase